jgi:hypothetical protein
MSDKELKHLASLMTWQRSPQHPHDSQLGCVLAAPSQQHNIMCTITDGWQATIYYDQQGANEFIPVKHGLWFRLNLTRPRIAQNQGLTCVLLGMGQKPVTMVLGPARTPPSS